MKLRVICDERMRIPPRHYGLAFFDVYMLQGHYYVIPLNYLVRLYYWACWRWDLLRSRGPEWIPAGDYAERLREAQEWGEVRGEERGYMRARHDIKQESWDRLCRAWDASLEIDRD